MKPYCQNLTVCVKSFFLHTSWAEIDKPVACIIKLHVHLGLESAGSAMAFTWLK
jgi:hypothetical protein